jgi:hypothetical protein
MFIVKILDFLRLKRAIWIRLFDGTIELTYIHIESPLGKMAYRYPIFKIGGFVLYEDGTCSSYVDSWKYYREWKQ